MDLSKVFLFYTVIFRYTPEVNKLKQSVFVWKAPGFFSCNGFFFFDLDRNMGMTGLQLEQQ